MVYDNTKFYAAFDKWLEHNVEVGFGEHYAGELLEDFCEYCRETGMLKRSPGRVVFGQRMREKGFERRKVGGRAYWCGLSLKNPREVEPIHYAPTVQKFQDAALEQRLAAREEALQKSPDARQEALRDFQKELEEEERRLMELENATPG